MTYHPPSTDILRALSIKGDSMTSEEQALAAKMIAERAREIREGKKTFQGEDDDE